MICKELEMMHDNIIIEGNTIYELDPDCVREKAGRNRKSGGRGRQKKEAGSDNKKRVQERK